MNHEGHEEHEDWISQTSIVRFVCCVVVDSAFELQEMG
jgi:hypothetical protein